MKTTRDRRGAAWPWLLCLVALPLSSCRFLADEFTVLDRAGPVTERTDAPVDGALSRP